MKRNYAVIFRVPPIHDKEYHKHEGYEDRYMPDEKITSPFYVNGEEDSMRKFISYQLTALELLRNGRSLSNLIPQDFANLIEELLVEKGWIKKEYIFHKYNARGILAKKSIEGAGNINCIWIPKKYSLHRKVGVEAIRELEYLIDKMNVSKGCLVTTSFLTEPAIKFVNECSSRMFYIDNEILEKELKGHL